MYLLPKLLALQLLLLCVATKAEGPWSLKPKGGFFYDEHTYIVMHGQPAEKAATFIGNSKTEASWSFLQGALNPQPGNLTAASWSETSRPQGGDQPDIITSTLRYTAHKDMGAIQLVLTHDEYFKENMNKLAKTVFLTVVQYGPEISIMGENAEFVGHNDTYNFMEYEQISLRCYAEGLINTTIEWVDFDGNQIFPSQVTELGPVTIIPEQPYQHFKTWQMLNVTAQREMTAFGCRMRTPNASAIDVTTWFDFKVESNDTLLIDDTPMDDNNTSNSNAEDATDGV